MGLDEILGVIVGLAILIIISLAISLVLLILLALRAASKHISRLRGPKFQNLLHVSSVIGIAIALGGWGFLIVNIFPVIAPNLFDDISTLLGFLLILMIISLPMFLGGYGITGARDGIMPVVVSVGIGLVPALLGIWVVAPFDVEFAVVVPGFISIWVTCAWLILTIIVDTIRPRSPDTLELPDLEGDTKAAMGSVGMGFLIALFVGVIATRLLSGLGVPLILFFATWIVVSWLMWGGDVEEDRTDLVITDVQDRPTGVNRDVSITNTGENPVDLSGATIYDTESTELRITMETLLPQQTVEIVLPHDFDLVPRPTDIAIGPISISRGVKKPRLVVKTGNTYALQWAADPSGMVTGVRNNPGSSQQP